MTRFGLWGLSAVLAGGGAVTAADLPPPRGEPTTLMNKLFGPRPPKPVGPAVAGAPDRPPTITAPLAPEVVKGALRAEQDAYLRRLSVCTELRRVAAESGDDALARQADELERQVTTLYHARVAGLGVPRVKSSLPDDRAEPALAAFDPPASAAERARRLASPSSPAPGSTAGVIREVPKQW